MSFQLSKYFQSSIRSLQVSDRARINQNNVGVYGVMPSMFEATVSDFLNVDLTQSPTLTGLPLGEQVYTPRGSQGFLLGSYLARQIGAYNTA